MTARQDLIARATARLVAQGITDIPGRTQVHEALIAEGWTPTTDESFRRLVGAVGSSFINLRRDEIVSSARTRAGLDGETPRQQFLPGAPGFRTFF